LFYRYLSTGLFFKALTFDFNLCKSTISYIVFVTCQVIWAILQPTEMSQPTNEKWIEISKQYYIKTNFPNCLGAIDGKYIRCKNPNNSGS